MTIEEILSTESIVERVSAAATAALRAGRTSLRVLQVAEMGIAAVKAADEFSPQRAQRVCRAGCSSCCHLVVSITPPEALFIAERLRATRSADELAAVRARIAATAAQVEHLTIEERAHARVPCALLSAEGACSIHEFRPLGCRGWTSFSKESCDAALREARPGHGGPQDRALHAAASAASEAIGWALREERMHAGNYEFHGGLLRAIDTPDAAQRWADDEDVFAGCGRVRSELLKGS